MNEQLIKELSDKLGVAAEVLWAALLKQAPIAAASSFMTSTILLSVAAAAIYAAWRFWKNSINAKNDYDEQAGWQFACGLACVVSIITVFVFTVTTHPSEVLAGFFNPEYWALKQILP